MLCNVVMNRREIRANLTPQFRAQLPPTAFCGALVDRFQHGFAAHVGLQDFWYVDRAVGVLVVFQDGDQPARGGQGAVEGCRNPGSGAATVVVIEAFPHIMTARLEGGDGKSVVEGKTDGEGVMRRGDV